jgi:hypothetical protein
MFRSWELPMVTQREHVENPRRRTRRTAEITRRVIEDDRPLEGMTHYRYEFLLDALGAYLSRNPHIKTSVLLKEAMDTAKLSVEDKSIEERITGGSGIESGFGGADDADRFGQHVVGRRAEPVATLCEWVISVAAGAMIATKLLGSSRFLRFRTNYPSGHAEILISSPGSPPLIACHFDAKRLIAEKPEAAMVWLRETDVGAGPAGAGVELQNPERPCQAG